MSCLDEFNEKSDGCITLAFTDEDGNAVIPSAVTWTLYDDDTKAIINSRQNVALTPLASSMNLLLTPSDNVIINTNKHSEKHVIEVKFTYTSALGAGRVGYGEYPFDVINLQKVT